MTPQGTVVCPPPTPKETSLGTRHSLYEGRGCKMTAKPLSKVLYTAEATVQGGRAGHGRTADGRLDVELSVPEDMGGQGGPGTNPEQLFAVGYAACFQSALLGVAQGRQLDASDSLIRSRVGIGPTGHGGFGLQVALDLTRPASFACRGRGPDGPRGPAVPVLQRHPRQHPGHPQRRWEIDRAGGRRLNRAGSMTGTRLRKARPRSRGNKEDRRSPRWRASNWTTSQRSTRAGCRRSTTCRWISAMATSWCWWARQGRASRPRCGWWRGWRRSPPGRSGSATGWSTTCRPATATSPWCSRTTPCTPT